MPRTASALALLGLGVIAGCARPTPSPFAHLASPRVVVAPVSFDQHVTESLEPGLPVLGERIAAYLEGRGCRVERPGFTEFDDLWQASGAARGALHGPDGEPLADAYDEAIGLLAAALREREAFDAIVIPYLLVRTAKVRGQTGVWDDSRQRIPVVYDHADRFQVEAVGMELPATSLQVRVYGSDGRRLHLDTQGLELAARMEITNNGWYRLVARRDLFQDREGLDQEIRQALAPVFE